ncbi:MAG: aminotransferase class I/II-fold pyridoxal phosphate-dependent enzyme [Acidobacteriota bacterium]|nr:aminotransferase class I/II-fold pyridoxal phosphate-dependent enzyme [Acidobacteriota bacterium]
MSQPTSGLSRRSFMRTLGAASVAVTSFPALAAVQGAPAPGQGRRGADMADMGMMMPMSPDTVVISSNENPLGPAPSSLEAISKTAALGNRYHFEITMQAVSTINDLFGLKKGYVGLFPGSGGPLDLALISNIGPDRPLVYGDPSYEQGPRAAEVMKAPRFPVKLTSTYAHDVKAMLAATPKAGAYYIVNPNNPTGTMTPKSDIIWLLKNKPAGSVVIVDEAYHHFSADDSCIDLVAADQDIIVTRTFSKIYGMAGLRAGVAIAKPELLAKFSQAVPIGRSLASISITSAAAARASLLDKDLVPLRRKINADNRDTTLEFLAKKGFTIIPGSQANFFMVDVKRPGSEFAGQMRQENVAIGRTWAAMPTFVRVTVGTKDEMQKFQSAFVKCMDKPSSTVNGAASLHHLTNPTELFRGEISLG